MGYSQYVHVANDEEGLIVVAKERAISPDLSGFEKHLIEISLEIAEEAA